MEPSPANNRVKLRTAFERLRALWSSSSLPPAPTDSVKRQSSPEVHTLQNSFGAKTHLSIERVEPNSQSIKSITCLRAAQNTQDGARHTLEYDFTEGKDGQLTVQGKIFELGATSPIPQANVSFAKTLLMEFSLASAEDDSKDATRIRQAVFGLSEAFTDDGCMGVDLYVQTAIESSQSNMDWKLYGKRMEQHTEASEVEEVNTERYEDIKHVRRQFSPREWKSLERIYEALLAIDDLSIEQYQALYNQGVVVKPVEAFQEEALSGDAEQESGTNIKHVALSRSFPFSRVWINLFSPYLDRKRSVVVGIQLPFSRAPKSAELNNLLIEVRSPQNKLFFCERYRVQDAGNVLAIDRYSNNDDFFRNLFRELHGVNHSEFEDARKTAHILELLAAYDLVAKPHGMLTRLSRAWSVASAFLTGIPA